MMKVLNRAQALCLAAYANGEFEYLVNLATQKELDAELKGIADGLLQFLVVELSDSEDCDSVDDALRRMNLVVGDLQRVKSSLENELDVLSDLQVELQLTTRNGRTGTQLIGSGEEMAWDSDGEDETVRAQMTLFRHDLTGLDQVVETFVVDGDQWRQLESEGEVDDVKANVLKGMGLSRAIAMAAVPRSATVVLSGGRADQAVGTQLPS